MIHPPNIISLFCGLLAAGCLLACGSGEQTDTAQNYEQPLVNEDAFASVLTFAFYNVENLFDPADDPVTEDEDFTPHGKMKWTNERVDTKLEGISRAIRSMNGNNGPDVIGFCEVENRRVLELLVDEFLPQGVYDIVHRHSPDGRGIDVALIYKKAAMEVVSVKGHQVGLGIGAGPTRDILEVRFQKDDRYFTVLLNHWPSRRGGKAKSEYRRVIAAGVAAKVIDSLYAADPNADIVMMGDFNDEPEDRSIVEVLEAKEYAEGKAFTARMINLAAPLVRLDTIGTYLYKDDWEVIDQIMLSRGVLDNKGLALLSRAETIFHPEFLRDYHPSQPLNPPRRTFVRGTLYIGGTSDHFPVFARLGWNP